MNEQKLNIELFKKIRVRIATFPETFDQSCWASPSPDAPCGTAACLAGEAIICNAPTVKEGIAELNRLADLPGLAVANEAARLLGLSGDYEGETLEDEGETAIFRGLAEGWPEPFRSHFNANEPEAAVAFLDHIIETGKVLE